MICNSLIFSEFRKLSFAPKKITKVNVNYLDFIFAKGNHWKFFQQGDYMPKLDFRSIILRLIWRMN